MSEGSLEAPERHPIPWRDPEFTDPKKLDQELRRVFDICHGCRRCFNLCDSFPRLFDLIDAAPSGELATVHRAASNPWGDARTRRPPRSHRTLPPARPGVRSRRRQTRTGPTPPRRRRSASAPLCTGPAPARRSGPRSSPPTRTAQRSATVPANPPIRRCSPNTSHALQNVMTSSVGCVPDAPFTSEPPLGSSPRSP